MTVNIEIANEVEPENSPRAKIYPFSYSVSISELSKFIAIPFLMTILTCGLALPYFQCAMTNLFTARTRFFGAAFEYNGRAKDLIWGYLARLGFLVSSAALVYFTGKIDDVVQILSASFFVVATITLVPISLLATFAYRINHISWGGNQFGLDVSRRIFVARFLHGFSLTCLTLGLAFPYFLNEIYKTVWSGFRVGPLQTMYSGQLKHLFKLHFVFLILFVPTLGLNTFWYVAKLIRYFANASWLGSSNLGAARGFCDLKGEDLVGLLLLNFLAIVGSLGLALPWVIHHTYAYLMQRFKFYGDVNFSLVVQDQYENAEPNHATEFVPAAS